MHIIAAKAVSFKEALSDDFKVYQQQIIKNAAALADQLKKNGFRLVSGGTDNHLMLVDVYEKGITGKEAENLLDCLLYTSGDDAGAVDACVRYQCAWCLLLYSRGAPGDDS